MTLDTKDEEGSFILPTEDSLFGKFRCAMCASFKLRIDYDPYHAKLTISCEQCGNFVQLNFAVSAGVNNVRD